MRRSRPHPVLRARKYGHNPQTSNAHVVQLTWNKMDGGGLLIAGRIHGNALAAFGLPLELNQTVNPGKKCVVGPNAHVAARENPSAALAHQNGPRTDLLAAES